MGNARSGEGGTQRVAYVIIATACQPRQKSNGREILKVRHPNVGAASVHIREYPEAESQTEVEDRQEYNERREKPNSWASSREIEGGVHM